MKIAQVIGTFPPHHGGMGYICYHNTVQLARKGHEVTVFTLDYGISYSPLPKQNFKIVRLKALLKYGDAGVVPQLAGMLKNFHIVHLHYPFFGAAEYVYLNHVFNGTPYFLTYHMDVFGDTGLKKLLIAGYEPLLMKRIVTHSSGICSPGNTYLKSTKAAGFIPWEKVMPVGYGGVDIHRYAPREKDQSLIDRHGLKNKTVGLFVGNLIPFKGLHLLIDVVAEIDDKDFVLVVVGGGYNEDAYKKQVEERKISNRLIFAGPQLPSHDLPAYYNLSDFLVLPSTHSESFGLVILEAMASGKPAIVSDLPGPSQLVNHETDGLIFKTGSCSDLKKKMVEMICNKTRIEKMGKQARKKVVDKYTWGKIGMELETAFQSILTAS